MMSFPDAPRPRTRFEVLDSFEREWRSGLETVSLAAEMLDRLPIAGRDEALESLGYLYQRQDGPGRRLRVLRRWPAVHVMTTTGVAADHYEMGTFWPRLGALLGVRTDQTFQREWGEAFLSNLSSLGLPTFEDDDRRMGAGTKYVGRILIHCGMPTHCLADFFGLINQRRARVSELTPEDFVAWANTPSAAASLAVVNMPVRRFLRFGEVFAVDVAGRCMELLDVIAASGPTNDVPLPLRFRDAGLKFHQDQGASVNRSSAHPVSASIRPQIVLDPNGQGPMLRLPPVGEVPDGRAVWLLDLDGKPQRIQTQALWPGANEPAPQTDVPLLSPVRTVRIALDDRPDLQLQMTVVDADDPLLAFGDDGVALPSSLPFPARTIWLLYPSEIESLTFAGDAPVLAEALLAPGWDGWSLKLVDLKSASSVTIAGITHPVRTHASARISVTPPVPGVRTASGLQVIPTVPTIELPQQLDQAAWDVAVLGQDGVLLGRWTRGHATPDPNCVWSSIQRPILGTFTVRVRGPWGRGATRTVTIVEGLTLRATPSWRWLVPNGLQPVDASVHAAEGMTVSRCAMSLTARELDASIEVSAHGVRRTLKITPPHMTVSYLSDESIIGPAPAAVPLIREDLMSSAGALIIDVGSAAEPQLHLRANRRIVQTIHPKGGRVGTYRFNLGALVDTLANHPSTDLVLDEGGTVTVASIRPRALYSQIVKVGDRLQFVDCVNADGLQALLYAAWAPWREPEAVAIKDGQALLPDWMIHVGPLLVIARIEDPWAPLPVPLWPGAGEADVVPSAGWLVDGDAEEQAVSTFLAGLRPLPATIAHHGRLWTIRGRIGRLALASRIGEVVDAIDTALQADPRPALLALSGSQAPTDEIPSLLIRTGIVWADLSTAHEDEPPTWSVRGALPAALLSAADAAWSAEEVEAASEVCGAVVAQLLRGIDPFARDGRLDDAAVVLAQHPERRDQIVRQLGLVPKGLLSGDTRVMAAMDLVRDREDSRLSWLNANAHRVLAQTMEAVRLLNDPLATASFAARHPLEASGGWRALPGISLGLAFAARHAARGNEAMRRWIPRQRRCWADLAAVAPQMVTIDLILAELLVAGSHDRLEGRAT